MMKLTVVGFGAQGGGNTICSVEVPENGTVGDLKNAIYAAKDKNSKFQPCRQRLAKEDKKTILKLDTDKLSAFELKDGDEVMYKDLGPQLKFVTVYLYEYGGPLVIYLLLTLMRGCFRDVKPMTLTQKVACFFWTLHYIKRILETLFVHEFGGATMPVRNIFKNCAYYWGFALLNGIVINSSWDSDPAPWHFVVGSIGFIGFMICNFKCHLILRALRTPGSQEIKIPRGFLFELVSFPNYFCELSMWFCWSILVGFKWSAICFNCCGIYQMMQWARERHQKYLDQFKDYPKNRKRLFPFVW